MMKSSHKQSVQKYDNNHWLVPMNEKVTTNDEGVTEYEYDEVIVEAVDYPSIVTAIIRSRYSADQVEAILLNGNDTPEHEAEYAELQQWRKTAKQMAKEVLANEEH